MADEDTLNSMNRQVGNLLDATDLIADLRDHINDKEAEHQLRIEGYERSLDRLRDAVKDANSNVDTADELLGEALELLGEALERIGVVKSQNQFLAQALLTIGRYQGDDPLTPVTIALSAVREWLPEDVDAQD